MIPCFTDEMIEAVEDKDFLSDFCRECSEYEPDGNCQPNHKVFTIVYPKGEYTCERRKKIDKLLNAARNLDDMLEKAMA